MGNEMFEQTVSRKQLQLEIEQTREQFQALLQSIPTEAFDLPSKNPAWTIGQVLFHMSLAPRFMVVDITLILKRPFLLKWLPKLFPKWLFHWLNARLTRFGARDLEREFLAQAYDKAHHACLNSLNSVSDPDLLKIVQYPDWDPLLSGEITVAYLFSYIKRHFDSHATEIRHLLGQTE